MATKADDPCWSLSTSFKVITLTHLRVYCLVHHHYWEYVKTIEQRQNKVSLVNLLCMVTVLA
ncbi:uncharacterized protein CYBJADRAFT_170078, partial [Cyberlindnera jadinii NRRL Y-1542]